MSQLDLPIPKIRHLLGWAIVDAAGKPMPTRKGQPPGLYYNLKSARAVAARKGGQVVAVFTEV